METPKTRADFYGLLIRRYKRLEKKKQWFEPSGMLPETDVRKAWTVEVLKDDGQDVKHIYHCFADAAAAAAAAADPDDEDELRPGQAGAQPAPNATFAKPMKNGSERVVEDML